MRGSIVAAALLAACEAQPHVDVKFRGAALEPAKLHVELREDARPEWEPADVIASRASADGIACEIQLAIGPRQSVFVRGWYDANGNGQHDADEPAGELGSAFEARDSGGCSRREANRAPDIVLATGSAGSAW